MRAFFDYTKDLLVRAGAAAGGFLYGLGHTGRASATLLLVLMAADYLSGLAVAALGKSPKSEHGKLSSKSGAKGLLHKAMILLVVSIACVLDWFVNEGNAMFATAATWFYISNEALSLLENLALAGVPVPKRLRRMLEEIGDEDDAPPDAGARIDGDIQNG